MDSAAYRYGTTSLLGSEFNYVFMDYDVNYNPVFDIMAGLWASRLRVKADTAALYINTGLDGVSYYTYNTSNEAVTIKTEYTGLTDTTIRQFFYTGQLLDSLLELYYNGTDWDTTFKRYYTYDGNNRIVKDSLYMWNGINYDPYNKYVYKYDGQGNVTEFEIYNWDVSLFVWDIASIDSNTYDISNHLIQIKSYYDANNNNIPVISSRDTFIYTNGADVATTRMGYIWDNMSNQYEDFYREQRILNNQVLPDSIYRSLWDDVQNLWDTISVEKYMYTGMNSPEHAYSYSNTQATVPAEVSHYYYGLYDPTASVKNTGNKMGISVYPNPVVDVLYVRGLDKAGTIRLVNCLGQIVKMMSVVNSRAEISVDDLLPGIYWLNIVDGGNQNAYSQTIIKE
jgi:hypothetical protein